MLALPRILVRALALLALLAQAAIVPFTVLCVDADGAMHFELVLDRCCGADGADARPVACADEGLAHPHAHGDDHARGPHLHAGGNAATPPAADGAPACGDCVDLPLAAMTACTKASLEAPGGALALSTAVPALAPPAPIEATAALRHPGAPPPTALAGGSAAFRTLALLV